MTEYKKVPLKRYPEPDKEGIFNVESRHWSSSEWFTVLAKQAGPVSCIHFNPVTPHEFAVTAGNTIQIYDPNTNEVKKSMAKSREVVYSGTFRGDGQLLVAGGDEGIVRIFDIARRNVLRNFHGHERPVHLTRFSASMNTIMSASDDTTVRCWDLSTSASIVVFKGHQDHVRCGAVGAPSSPDVWISGSYDHTIKLWDVRTGDTIRSFNHGAPVEDVLVYPTGTILVSAGGNKVNIWDLFKGQLVESLEIFQKTVTSLAYEHKRGRLITGSLDHVVKILSTDTYTVMHSMTYSSPVMSVAISPAGTHLVTGMVDGTLSIRHRTKPNQSSTTTPAKTDAPNRLKRDRDDSIKVDKKRTLPYSQHDRFMRSFQYKKALDAAIKSRNPIIAVSVIEELMLRQSLNIALSGRDEVQLEVILQFLRTHINDPKYSKLIIHVINQVLDIYAPVVGQSASVDAMLRHIKQKVEKEVKLQRRLLQTLGALDTIINGK